VTVLLDDHLLRDWMTGPDPALRAAVGGEPLATTNLWYARLCKSAASAGDGALLGALSRAEREAVVAALVRLPDDVAVVPMRQVAWRMGLLVSAERGRLSTLGSEVVAAAEVLGARVLASSRDDGPGIRRCCRDLRIPYETVTRRVRGTATNP
jgi:hypothetical protein